MKIIDYYDLDLPEYSISYLINGDGSGLEDEYIETMDEWYADMLEKIADRFPGCSSDIVIKDNDEGGFTPFPEFGLACNCVDAAFVVWAENDDPRPAFPLPWEEEEDEDEDN